MLLPFKTSVSIDGNTYEKTTNITGDVPTGPNHGAENPLPVAHPGTLTARSSASVGTITLESGHGLTTGAHDLIWEGGGRRGVTCTITVDACVLSGGTAGSTDLPALTTPIWVCPIKTDSIGTIVGGNVRAICIKAIGDNLNFAFYDDTGTPALIVGAEGYIAAGQSYIWYTGVGTNPLTGENVTQLRLSSMSEDGGKMRSLILFT